MPLKKWKGPIADLVSMAEITDSLLTDILRGEAPNIEATEYPDKVYATKQQQENALFAALQVVRMARAFRDQYHSVMEA